MSICNCAQYAFHISSVLWNSDEADEWCAGAFVSRVATAGGVEKCNVALCEFVESSEHPGLFLTTAYNATFHSSAPRGSSTPTCVSCAMIVEPDAITLQDLKGTPVTCYLLPVQLRCSHKIAIPHTNWWAGGIVYWGFSSLPLHTSEAINYRSNFSTGAYRKILIWNIILQVGRNSITEYDFSVRWSFPTTTGHFPLGNSPTPTTFPHFIFPNFHHLRYLLTNPIKIGNQ